VLPANQLTKRIGRRLSLIVGLSIAVFAALVSAAAAYFLSFELLVFGALSLGFSMAFVAQMRFCALESVDDKKDSPKALSILMVGGIFAAILGPELAVAGKDWITSTHGFSGSFIGLACLLLLSIGAITQLSPSQTVESIAEEPARKIGHVIKQPIFLVALSSAAIGYGLMSYIMTATPLSMHVLQGHSLEETKWVVQSHIIAMYLPSLFSAFLVKRIGLRNLMLIGCLCYFSVVLFALVGQEVLHYWWVMVLLGIGWNFLFLAGTLLLPHSYQNNERLKVQSINDFSIFAIQATVSLLAGIILFNLGWMPLILFGLPFIILMLLISIYANFSVSISEKLNN